MRPESALAMATPPDDLQGLTVYGSEESGSVAVNIRCIENIDLDSVAVTHFDGRSK